MSNVNSTPDLSPVKLTTSQKEFIKLLLNHDVFEATQIDTGEYYINVQVKGKWAKKLWTSAEIQALVDAEYLNQFPNRWNPEHLVVTINENCRAQLRKASAK